MAETLSLPLPEPTLRKLKALANLSNLNIDELEAKLAGLLAPHFDRLLTDEIAEAIGYTVPQGRVFGSTDISVPDAVNLDHSEHGLSNDEDDGQDTTPRVEVEGAVVPAGVKAPEPAAAAPVDPEAPWVLPDMPEVGDDAEAFVEAAMEAPKKGIVNPRAADLFFEGERTTKARAAFDSNKPRVRIAEFTGDE